MTKQMGAVPINQKTWADAAHGNTRQHGGGDVSHRQMGDGYKPQVSPGSYKSLTEAWGGEDTRQMVYSSECTQQMC